MRKTLMILTGLVTLLAAASCRSIGGYADIKNESLDSKFTGGAGKKILVVMATGDPALREDVENKFAIEGAKRKVELAASHLLVPNFRDVTRERLTELVKTNGFDRVLVIRSVPRTAKEGKKTEYSDYYTVVDNAGLYVGWGAMMSTVYSPTDPPPTMGRYMTLTIESLLYDSSDASQIWKASTSVTTSERPGEAAGSYADTVVTRLSRAGLI